MYQDYEGALEEMYGVPVGRGGYRSPTYTGHHHATWYTEKEEYSKPLQVGANKILDEYLGKPLSVFREKKEEINQKILDVIKRVLENAKFHHTIDWCIHPESFYDESGVAILLSANIEFKSS